MRQRRAGAARATAPLMAERMTVAMGLAEKLHLSAQRPDGQGKGVGPRDELYGDDLDPPTPQPELFSLHEEEPGRVRPDRLPAVSGPQERVSGAPCSRSSILSLRCRLSTILRRRWWNSCRISCFSSTHSHLILSRLSKCPRACPWTSLCERWFASRGCRNSWWKCRRPFPTHLLYSGVWSRSLTFQPQFVEFLAVFKIFRPEQSSAQRTASEITDIPVPGRGGSGCLLGFHPEQGTTALHVSQERISERIVEQIGASGDSPSRRAGPRFVLRDRVQQLLVPSRSPTLLLLEVLTVFCQDRFQRRLLDLFTLKCTCPTLPSGWSSTTTQAGPTSGTGVPT